MNRNVKIRAMAIALYASALCLDIQPGGAIGMSAARAESEALRPEVAKPLVAAQELSKAKKFREALARIGELDAVGGKTAAETFAIERTRSAIALMAGDETTAARSLEAVIAAGRLPPTEQVKFIQALAGAYYRQHDYAKTIQWLQRYQKEGGDDPRMGELLLQTYYLNNDFAHAAQEVRAAIHAAEKSGARPPEEQLRLLASCALKQGDKAGYLEALEKFVAYYPKKEYWADLLNRLDAKPGFADRLALDLFRLKFAAGLLANANDYMEMAQLALQAGFPAEAKKVVEQGYQVGALGTGPDAARHKRMRDLVTSKSADDVKTMAQAEAEVGKSKDGIGALNLGYAYVAAGHADKGLPLMEQGMRIGGMKRPEDAKLHLGIAYLTAGQKTKALQALKTVQGTDGTADLARYWMLFAERPLN
jgi:hypothetical protein